MGPFLEALGPFVGQIVPYSCYPYPEIQSLLALHAVRTRSYQANKCVRKSLHMVRWYQLTVVGRRARFNPSCFDP